MMDTYSRTAILSKDNLARLGNGVECKYFLYCKVGTNASSRTDYEGSIKIETRVREIQVYVQLWDSERGTLFGKALAAVQPSLMENTLTSQHLLGLRQMDWRLDWPSHPKSRHHQVTR